MQRTRLDGRRIIGIILPIVVILLCILFDQITKNHFHQKGLNYEVIVIKDFLRFKTVFNEGAAFSMFANKSWAQTFFKILTLLCLPVFIFVFALTIKYKTKFLKYSMALMIAGMIGNFIDRLAFGYVVDFISFTFFGWDFAIFNLADTFLILGAILSAVFFVFPLDEICLFDSDDKKKDVKHEETDKKEIEEIQEITEEKVDNENV